MVKAPTPTVFVVDDDASLREAIRALLVSVGHNVESFPSVEEFTTRRDKREVSCLVLDVRLPGISGLEFQKLLSSSGDPIPTESISCNFTQMKMEYFSQDAFRIICRGDVGPAFRLAVGRKW